MSNVLPIRVVADVISSLPPASPDLKNTASSQAPVGRPLSMDETYPAVNQAEDVSRQTALNAKDPGSAAAGVDEAGMAKVVSDYIQQAQTISRDLEFTVDEELNRTIITVYDAETEKIIRKIPADEVLSLARTLARNEGVLLKDKA